MYQPKYTLTNHIVRTIGKIEAAKEVIENAPLLPMWEKKFRESALVRTVHHGTHIEGNQLDFEQAKEVILSQTIHARSRDVQEVLNYRLVMDVIEKKPDLNEETIRELQRVSLRKVLPEELLGHYRTKQVVIKDSATGEVTFTPPSPAEVPYLMKEFSLWLESLEKNDMHPVLKAAAAHHELVRIHPFLDGNGRVARALATLILYVENYDIRRFFSLEEQYDRDPLSYYVHLQKANSGDVSSWLEYFSQKLMEELELLKNKIKKLSVDSHLKDKLGGKQVFLNERQTQMIEYIQETGYMQNQAFGSLFPDYSEDTILRDLNGLIEKRLVVKIGKTKGARYVLVKD